MTLAARLGLFLAAWLCVPLAAAADEPLIIGSKDFTENRILAEVMAQLIRARTDLEVELSDGLGGTLVVFSALQSGAVDLYPEYTGTGWAVVLGETTRAGDPLSTYLHVQREYRRRFDIEWLAPFGFSNSYALAVRTPVAERLGLTDISDLAAHAAELSAGVSHEFLEREDGWPGLAATYGLEIGSLRGMEHGLAFEAIDAGNLDVIDAWTTDGKLLRYDLRVLTDDRGHFPPYQCAPIVRGDVLRRHPELDEVLHALAFTLPDARMQSLNHLVEVQGYSFREAARQFLVEEGLLDDVGADDRGAAGSGRRDGLWDFIVGRLGITASLAGRHLLLTGGAVLSAILVAVPLGILLTRRRRLAPAVLGAAGVIQTIPSLALLAFMIPWLGLGAGAALAALFLYALLPILRNAYTGILEVDADVVEAARGLGLTRGQILRHVELPLATRTLMAGIRTSTVISIGVATLAAFIGAGGLGEPIVTGLQLNDMRLVLSGAVPAALLAIGADQLLERLEARLAPRLGDSAGPTG